MTKPLILAGKALADPLTGKYSVIGRPVRQPAAGRGPERRWPTAAIT